MNLRPYQREAIDGLMDWFRANPTGNPMLVLPTGAGKSVVLAMLIREALEQWPATRVLMLTHVKELIQQNAAKMLSVWPQAPLGIYSAGLGRRDTFRQIIFAGIQSVHRKAMHLGAFDLIIIDECHLISHKAQGTYRAFLADCRRANPAVRIIGLTATPFRTTSGALTYGDDAMFSAIAYEVKMLDLIAQGYLAPLISKRMATEADLSGVQTCNGEFVAGQLERAMDRDSLTQAALDEVATYSEGRQRWLVFCAGVDHAEHVAQAMNDRGWAAGCITGKTPAGRREALIAQFRAGQLRALTNANVLTTGFDVPETDMLIMLRPTQSPGLYVQMIGRGSRIALGKVDCLVLDFAGNAARHGPVDQIRAWIPQPKGGGDAPMKICPQCQHQWATSVRVCTCGHMFEFDDTPPHAPSADDTPILSSDVADRLERHEVHHTTYREWSGRSGNAPTLRVDYHGPLMRIASEWICFEHTGYARSKAVAWWGKRAPGTAIPGTVTEALARTAELAKTAAIILNTRPKYPEITGYELHADG